MWSESLGAAKCLASVQGNKGEFCDGVGDVCERGCGVRGSSAAVY